MLNRPIKILVVGGGGREHAIIWKLKNNPKGEEREIFAAPGNGGISEIATCVPISAVDVPALVSFAKNEGIDFTVAGPDDSLAAGIVDEFLKNGLEIFGPTKAAARLESSKLFAKKFMKRHGIPTADFEAFDDYSQAVNYAETKAKYPCYIKADGLALGKGALYCGNLDEAKKILFDIMVKKKYGASGDTVLFEELLVGKETTVLAFCDGKTIRAMPSSMDYKKAHDGDLGPNTGGMGAICPSPYFSPENERLILRNVLERTKAGLVAENIDFKGILYFGLILTENGPFLIEYNARFGDPETQAILPLLQSDLLEVFSDCAKNVLDKREIKWDNNTTVVCVVLASGGYPSEYEVGFPIIGASGARENFGADSARESSKESSKKNSKDVFVFHAGTKKDGDEFLTSGGRVLSVVARAGDISAARALAYEAAAGISFRNLHKRTDIGEIRASI